MYAGIAGLKSHMQKLNVIGNNVANVNTYGYKAATMSFTESLYTTSKAGSAGTATMGGINPSQIGYGCSIGTIDLDMSTKSFVPTGMGTHSMIQGDGFYMVGPKDADPKNAGVESMMLTRVGKFKFDEDGYLVDPSGNVVYGFVSALAAQPAAGNLKLADNGYTNPGQTVGVSTELVPIRLPLAAKGTPNLAETDAAYIKPGTSIYSWVNDDGVTIEGNRDENGDLIDDGLVEVDPNAAEASKCINCDTATIDANGMVTVTNSDTGEMVVVGYVAIAKPENPYGVTHLDGQYYKAAGGAGDVRVGSCNNAVTGYLNNQEATADDLSTLDLITGASELTPGGLEASGTDVATEFSEMITTQRGYQANTRIITVTDSMLEELVNMKR